MRDKCVIYRETYGQLQFLDIQNVFSNIDAMQMLQSLNNILQ
jgi:hypothetical protein